jgi:hypothetical protein
MSTAVTTPARPLRLVRRVPRTWLIPVGVTAGLRVILQLGLLNGYQLVAIAVAVPAVILLARRPGLAIRLLVIVLPFQLVITSTMYEVGVAGPLVRMAGLWKEGAAASLVVAAWMAARRTRHHLDVVDRLALGYVVLGTLYLVVPELFIPGVIGSSLSVDVRFIGWRTMVLPVGLFLAARHVRLPPVELARVLRVAMRVGITLGAIALFEFIASSTWNSFMVDTIGVNRFRVEVLEVPPSAINFGIDGIRVYGEIGGREFVRVGGPMASYLQLSFGLLIAGGLLFERAIRGVRAFWATVGIALVGTGILLTQTRSSIVGGVLLAVTVLRPGAGRSETSRVRYTLLAAAAFALVLPLVLSSGLSDRFTTGDSASDSSHEKSFDHAWEVVRANPLGRGLATGAPAGAANVPESIIAENHFLDVGLQLGWLGMGLFVAVLLALIRTLYATSKTARDPTVQLGVLGMRNAVIALLVPCWYLHPLNNNEVSWVLFALAGAALGSAAAADEADHVAPRARSRSAGV